MRLQDVAEFIQGHPANGECPFYICLTRAQVWPFLQEAGEVILKGRQGSWPYKGPEGGRSKAGPKGIRWPEGTRS